MAGKRPSEELRFEFEQPAEDGSRERDAPAAERARRLRGVRLARQALEADEAAARPDPSSASSPALVGAAPDSAYSVAALYERLHLAFSTEFPDEIWVMGEIRKVSVSNGNRYIELADPDGASVGSAAPQGPRWGSPAYYGNNRQRGSMLEVACWRREWPTIAAELDAVGVELAPGLVVRVRGRIDASDLSSRIRLSLSDLDVEALVGRIAASRRRLLATLEREGVIDANRNRPVPLVPLRVGIVTSARSEAHRDFAGQLQRSGFAFETLLESSLVQGPDAPLQIAAALRRLRLRELDLVVLVRGGGARGDLAAFDHEVVARAILDAPYPVWTGIGHTGDESVADLVAHRAFPTPTKVGEAVVERVASYLEGVHGRAAHLVQGAERVLDGAAQVAVQHRSELARAARHELLVADGALVRARGRLERGATLVVERCAQQLELRAARADQLAGSVLAGAESHTKRQRALLRAFDPHRQLERGWSLTRDAQGRIVRSVDQVARGDEIVTLVADGSVVSEARSARKAGGRMEAES